MLVFDPLAVSLVVGANVIFRDKNKEKEKLGGPKDDKDAPAKTNLKTEPKPSAYEVKK